MIQPNELRIGNLVKPGPEHMPPFDVEKYCEVTQVYKEGFTVDYHYPGQWFEEIPLTPELLEKCGFYYKDGATEYGTESKNGVSLYVHDEDPGYFHFSKGLFNGTKTEIKHLHQLQNLYFAETGEELEIKI